MKLLLAILTIGFLLRVLWLDQFPIGFTGDETQQTYSAYSILKTGSDEWGDFLPIFPRGFGDYKAPLYTYLTIPSVALFGLNEFAGRLPAVLVGVITILAAFFLGRKLFNESVGLWAAFLIAFSPWHIQLSRTAFEAGIGVLLFSLGLYFFLKSEGGYKNMLFSVLCFGFNLYTYHSWRVFTILYGLFILILLIRSRKIAIKKILVSLCIFSLFLLPIIFNLKASMQRAGDVTIFAKKNIEGYFASKSTSDLPVGIAKVFDNKFFFVGDKFFTNYLSYFSPTFYFTGSRPDNSYLNFPLIPLLYPIELIFVSLGIFMLITKKEKNKKIIFAWILLAPIPAAMTDSLSAHRAVTLLPISAIISAYGLNSILINSGKFRKKMAVTLLVLILISFVYFLYNYIYSLPQHPSHNLRYGYKEIFLRAIKEEENYSSIHFSKVFSVPHIFVIFYKKIDPQTVQAASKDWLRYEKAGRQYIDQLESYNIGKYEIHDLDWKKDLNRGNVLLISKPEDFPENVISTYDFKDFKGKVLYRIIPVAPNVLKLTKSK